MPYILDYYLRIHHDATSHLQRVTRGSMLPEPRAIFLRQIFLRQNFFTPEKHICYAKTFLGQKNVFTPKLFYPNLT